MPQTQIDEAAERVKFEAALGKKGDYDTRFLLNFGTDVYFRAAIKEQWEGWLAAKRAVLSERPPLKDHVIREAVDKLTDVARQFHGAEQLRSRIADIVVDVLRAGPAVLSEPTGRDDGLEAAAALTEKYPLCEVIAKQIRALKGAVLSEAKPVGMALSESQMGIGYDRRMGNILWFGGYPEGPALLYAAAPPAAEAKDSERYRTFISSGFPICFCGIDYQDKASLDEALDAIAAKGAT